MSRAPKPSLGHLRCDLVACFTNTYLTARELPVVGGSLVNLKPTVGVSDCELDRVSVRGVWRQENKGNKACNWRVQMSVAREIEMSKVFIR